MFSPPLALWLPQCLSLQQNSQRGHSHLATVSSDVFTSTTLTPPSSLPELATELKRDGGTGSFLDSTETTGQERHGRKKNERGPLIHFTLRRCSALCTICAGPIGAPGYEEGLTILCSSMLELAMLSSLHAGGVLLSVSLFLVAQQSIS